MPTTRTRRQRTREVIEFDATIEQFLFTGEAPEGENPGRDLKVSRFFDQGEKIRLAWEQHREFLLSEWVKKNLCSRPWSWWRFDSPREQIEGWPDHERFYSAQRQRLGGKGQTTSEKYPAVVPSYERGLPSSWAEINRDDPPRFESETVHLQRHGLLTAAEEKYLQKHPELLEPERINID